MVLLRLWRKLSATAPIRALAWEHIYALGTALKKKKKKKKLQNYRSQSLSYLVGPGPLWISNFVAHQIHQESLLT